MEKKKRKYHMSERKHAHSRSMTKEDRNQQICMDYDSGMTQKEVGERYGISTQRVSKIISKYQKVYD